MIPPCASVDGEDPSGEAVASEQCTFLVCIERVSDARIPMRTLRTSGRHLHLNDSLQESSHALRRVEDLQEDLSEVIVVADGTHFAECQCQSEIGLSE